MTDSGGANAGLQSAGLNQTRPSGSVGSASGNPSPLRIAWPAWAIYLGVSWTWCIGMFLPALLWRDFGVWSFPVFAIPNIVGAALLGIVMRSPDASRAFIDRHRVACVAFSAVTVCFQVFFAAWVARVMSLGTTSGGWVWHLGWVACLAATVVGSLGGSVKGRYWACVVAAVVWAVSISTLIWVVMNQPDDGVGFEDILGWQRGGRPPAELVPLAMVCILGFMLCPYLDLTFHRGRIESGTQSGKAFGVGFGVFFALMIVGTLLTAPLLLMLIGGGTGGARKLLVILLALHTLPQLVFTCSVHASETRSGPQRLSVIAAAVVGVLVALVVLGGDRMLRTVDAQDMMRAPEGVYRCFMSFYGLVFPAYVAIVAWPVKNGGAEIDKRRLAVFAVVVLAAIWFYWLGFVERRTWWVAIGVCIVVAGKLISRLFDPTLARNVSQR